jgi:MSHA biogenesis protein MshM
VYLQHFGFSSQPFSDTPDVHLFWEAHCSQLVYKSLLQGLMDKSMLQLVTAEAGLGKSMLCRRLLNSLRSHRSRYDVLFIAFPHLSVRDVLNSATSRPNRGKRLVLIIDEAQSLSNQSLIDLTNVLENQDNNRPALQMVWFAQPELERRLEIRGLEQTALLVSKRYSLHPLTLEQTAAYIANRLRLTGQAPETLMNNELEKLAFNLTGGIPRLINTVMRKSLVQAFEEQSSSLSAEHLYHASQTTAAMPRIV